LFRRIRSGERHRALAVASVGVLLASSLISAVTVALPAQAASVPTNQADCVAAGDLWQSVNGHGNETCIVEQQPGYTASNSGGTNLDSDIQDWWYYNAVLYCVEQDALTDSVQGDGGLDLTPAQVKAGEWFIHAPNQVGAPSVSGDYMRTYSTEIGVDGNGNCAGNSSQLLAQAFTRWGLNGITVACATGILARTDGGNCQNSASSDDFVRPTKTSGIFTNTTLSNAQAAAALKTYLLNNVFGGTAPTLTDAAKYQLYYQTFMNGCGVSSPSHTSASDVVGSDGKLNDDSDSAYEIAVISGSGANATMVKAYYTASLTGNHSVPLKANADGSSTGTSENCDWLTSQIANPTGTLALAYLSAIKKGATIKPTGGADCTADPTAAGCSATTATSCNIDQIGWLLCPILTTGAHLADSAYGFLADNFLATNPSLLNTDPKATTTDDSGNTVAIGTGTYTAWKIMLTIANVAFIIAFLIVIFSQLTSVGVTNYGVKKLLPRLIVVAILVNVSFWVCAIAVDVSNILGYSLKDVLTSVADQVATSGGGTAVNTGDQSGNLFGIVTTIITVGSIAWVNLGAVVVAIVGALITLLIIFVLLAARQALIVLLVVIAPLAFVAYLLPNTESLFKKWRTMFTSLLLLFPIIGVLYGACLLASEILKQVAGSNVIMQIMAYVALVIPLIAIIPLLKGSLDGVGKIGANIQSFGSKARGAAGKKTQKTFDNSRLGQYKGYRSNRWGQRRAAIQGGSFQGRGGKANPLNWLSAANRGANSIGGRFGAKLTNQGAGVASKEDAELLGNAGSRLETMSFEGKPLSQDQLIQIAKRQDVTHDGTASGRVLAGARSFDEYSRRAAIERAGKTATVAQAHDLVDASRGMSIAERKALAGSLAGSNAAGKAPYLGGRTLAEIAQGTANVDNAALAALQGDKITAEALAGGDKDSIAKLVDVATKTPAGSRERAALQTAYSELMKPDSRLREHIAPDHDRALQAIKSL